MSEEEAVITNIDASPVEGKNKNEEVERLDSDEEEYDDEEYIEASRYSFELHKDHFIFDFNDVDPESDEEGGEMEEENEDNDENEEEEEEEGMEEEDTLTDQQREQAENEAREAVQKNITRRMGWFDMIRRLEKKVTNEKRMAQSGGYDLSDPFIDDGNLQNQPTSVSIPEPPPFQVLRYNASEAAEPPSESVEMEGVSESTKRRKGEKFQLTEKQKQQLAAWNPSPETKALLDTLKEKVSQFTKENPGISQMPSDFDDLLSEFDYEGSKGGKRPPALVWALVELFPFHPQTIKLRLRLLQRRRESDEIEKRYEKERDSFLSFMKEWSLSNNRLPNWTTETRIKMVAIYKLLEERIEKHTSLMKMEHLDTVLDFDIEFSSLTSTLLEYFAPNALTIMDLQHEFESAVQDEELATTVNEEVAEIDDDLAVITIAEEKAPSTVRVKTPVQSPVKVRIHSPKQKNTKEGLDQFALLQTEKKQGSEFRKIVFNKDDF